MPKYTTAEEWWRSLLTGDSPEVPVRQVRYVLSLLLDDVEQRQLELKGKSEPVSVRVLSIGRRQ